MIKQKRNLYDLLRYKIPTYLDYCEFSLSMLRAIASVLFLLLLVSCDSNLFDDQKHQAQSLFLRTTQGDESALRDLHVLSQKYPSGAFFIGVLHDPLFDHHRTNITQAITAYQAASQYPAAQFNLALLYLSGHSKSPIQCLGNQNNQPATCAIKLLTTAANRNCVHAKLLLGHIFTNGWSNIPKNLPLGLDWYQNAVDQFKDPQAELALGEAYLKGHGREIDKDRGLRFLESATRSGLDRAALILGEAQKEPEIKVQWFVVASILNPTHTSKALDALNGLPNNLRIIVWNKAHLWASNNVQRKELVDFSRPITKL